MHPLLMTSYLLGGVILLSGGAHYFVNSASHIAKRLGIPAVVIGLTVVAFGTSGPELAVNVLASLRGNSEIALGNVVGSNIFNVSVILGICALIMPLKVNMQLLKIDIPIMVVTSLFLWLLIRNGELSRVEGIILFIGILAYTFLQVHFALKEKAKIKEEFETEYKEEGKPLKDAAILILGLAMLIFGAHLFVKGAIDLARLVGISEEVIALTIIAAGTSLPEVATSISATLKGERDIAIGNVVGSNIFNILGILGISGIITSLPVDAHMAKIDIPIMIIIGVLMIPFTIKNKTLGRWGGFIFFSLWLAYTTYLITTGIG